MDLPLWPEPLDLARPGPGDTRSATLLVSLLWPDVFRFLLRCADGLAGVGFRVPLQENTEGVWRLRVVERYTPSPMVALVYGPGEPAPWLGPAMEWTLAPLTSGETRIETECFPGWWGPWRALVHSVVQELPVRHCSPLPPAPPGWGSPLAEQDDIRTVAAIAALPDDEVVPQLVAVLRAVSAQLGLIVEDAPGGLTIARRGRHPGRDYTPEDFIHKVMAYVRKTGRPSAQSIAGHLAISRATLWRLVRDAHRAGLLPEPTLKALYRRARGIQTENY